MSAVRLRADRPLRIGFDMDGVLADFAPRSTPSRTRLFPDAPQLSPPASPRWPRRRGAGSRADRPAKPADNPHETRRRREAIWNEIRRTPDFWTTLQPIDAGAVRRIHELMLRHRWEVFFITQRPATDGEPSSGRRSTGSSRRGSICRACW